MKRLLFMLSCLSLVWNVLGNNMEGVVQDERSGERLTGATVYIKGRETEAVITDLDGRFVLTRVPSGKVILVCSSISYETKTVELNIPKTGVVKLNLTMVTAVNQLKDIDIVATVLRTDASVRKLEKLSANLINVVGAKSIETSPDLSVGEVLGRVSGVTLEKNSSGEPEYAVLRGMDKRYNITLVNGVKISSPNNKQRFVPLNIFPSELLDRLEVSKNRSAQMEGDATGGSVNMVMKDAPSTFMLHVNVASGYNTLLLDRPFDAYDHRKTISVAPYEKLGSSYSSDINDFGRMNALIEKTPLPNLVAGISVGGRLLENRLGIIFAVNYQSLNKGTDATSFDDQMIQTESMLRITKRNDRFYSENQQQLGAHAKLDFVLSPQHSFEWYNFVVLNDHYQVRKSTSTNYQLFYDPANGDLDLGLQTRLRSTHQQIMASTLEGHHQLGDKLDMDWTAVYSNAGLQRPDENYVRVDNLIQSYVDHYQIDGDGSYRIWEHNSDQDLSLLVDLKYLLPMGSRFMKFQAGGLVRSKTRDNHYVKYTFKPVDLNQAFQSIDEIEWTLYTPKGSVGPLTYEASEFIGAGYAQAVHENGAWQFIGGVRAEYTDQGYHMFYPNAGEPADGNQSYLDFLPNVLVKYSPNEQVNWRFSYFRSVNRPGFFEIVPYQIQEEEYTEYGNKNLQHTTIDNLDIRWELFPNPVNQLLIGVFFKRIDSPIEFAYYSVNQRQSGYGLQNLGDARNLGLEVDFIRYIQAFGFKANYTYTNSAITTSKVYYAKDEWGNTKTMTGTQTRPLVNQAAHVANLSFLYKDVDKGWDGQLSAAYTGDRIVVASRYLDSDYWEKAAINLDASIEKSFKNGLSLFAKANNLLNTPTIRFVKTHNSYNDVFPLQSAESDETLIRRYFYKPTLLAGIRFKF